MTHSQRTERPEVFKEVKGIFSEFLEKNGQRKTPERFAILECIYSRDDHFEAEVLLADMKDRNYRVSRATVYNTLELLVNCELVTKHQFGKNQAQYEKAFGYRQHDHLICVNCKQVVEFCDPRIQQIKNMIGELFEYEIHHHSLQLFGSCKNCGADALRMNQKNKA